MSDTPRTDELEFEIQGDFVVYADECRQLERELAQAYERAAQVCDRASKDYREYAMNAFDDDDHDGGRGVHNFLAEILAMQAAAIRALKPKSGNS